MPGESLTFDILASDHASSKFRDVGDAALSASAKMDVAAASAKLWSDTTIKQGRAADTAVAAMKSHTAATALLADAENVLAGKATVTTKLMADQGRTFEDAGKAAEKAAGTGGTSGLSALIGGGGLQGGGMAALIGAGVALSPVIATLGVGLTGFGAAAYAVAAPILKAAQATGGLAANMATLDPEEQKIARGLLGLGQQFGAFEQQLKPAVFTVFNEGIRLAGHLLADVAPVAKATGTALGAVLGEIDAEFQSGTWQQFFGFMARTAAPDVHLLALTFINLMDTLPPLLQLLQPVATDVLGIAAGFSKLVDVTARTGQGLTDTGQHMNFLQKITAGMRTVLVSPGVGLLDALRLLHIVGGAPAAPLDKTGKAASTAATEIQSMATATANLMTAQANAVATQTAYGSAILTSANDAVALEKALDKSRGAVGLHTAAQRASFGAANTYINDLAAQATQAVKSGHGTDAAILAIRKGLPVLDSAKTKNRQYWQEVQTLVGWLHNLENIKAIHETVFVTGNGTFTVRPGTKLGLPGGSAGGPFPQAAGGLLRGGVPGKDSIPILAMPGEVIVPTNLVAAGVVDHLRGRLPGFASGGLVPSYSGNVAGLPAWGGRDLNATVHIIEQAVVKATVAAIHAAAAAARTASIGAASGSGGPASGAVRALQSYAASLFGQFGWGSSQLGPLIALWNGESGWNPMARNPSSGAFGIPQALPPGKMGALAASGNAAAQIRWGEGYIHSVYGTPSNAYSTWLSRSPHWYDDGGFLPIGPSLAMNNTGQPERVTSPGQESAMLAALGRIEKLLQVAPARTGGALGDALHGTARSARYSGMYSPRGA